MGSDFQLPAGSDDYATSLSGRYNQLWRWGERAVSGKGPTDWRGDLGRWLDDSREPIRWVDYGSQWQVTQRLAAAMGAVILAAGALDGHHGRFVPGALGGRLPILRRCPRLPVSA